MGRKIMLKDRRIEDLDNPKTSAGFIAGIYRLQKEAASMLEKISSQLASLGTNFEPPKRAACEEHGPEQLPLPGFSAEKWTPPEIEAKKPREWCNTVKVYEVIWEHFGKDGRPFGLADFFRTEGFLTDVSEATKNRVAPASLSKMLSVTTRAEATHTIRKGVYRCCEPTDELREAIERTAKKRAAAKEVSA